jgi:hypothetical protein
MLYTAFIRLNKKNNFQNYFIITKIKIFMSILRSFCALSIGIDSIKIEFDRKSNSTRLRNKKSNVCYCVTVNKIIIILSTTDNNSN